MKTALANIPIRSGEGDLGFTILIRKDVMSSHRSAGSSVNVVTPITLVLICIAIGGRSNVFQI